MAKDLQEIADNATKERQRLQREFADHPGPAHCTHNAGAPYMAIPQCAQFPQGVIGAPKTCCWCGPTRVHYVGVVEPGHGPFVTYEPGSQIVVARG